MESKPCSSSRSVTLKVVNKDIALIMTKVPTIENPMTATVPIRLAWKGAKFPNKRPSAPAALTALDANTGVNKEPIVPPIP